MSDLPAKSSPKLYISKHGSDRATIKKNMEKADRHALGILNGTIKSDGSLKFSDLERELNEECKDEPLLVSVMVDDLLDVIETGKEKPPNDLLLALKKWSIELHKKNTYSQK
jgi:hypothetical protein